jgi:hypothetical protein
VTPEDLEGMEAVTEGLAEFMASLDIGGTKDLVDAIPRAYRQGYADGYTQAGEDIN